MLTTTAMCTRIRVADGKNTTTAVGTAYRTPDRHSRSTPNSRRVSGAISAPLPPLGAREAGAAALVALIVVREAVGTLAASAGAEEVWGGGTLAVLVEGGSAEVASAASAVEGFGGRSSTECRVAR